MRQVEPGVDHVFRQAGEPTGNLDTFHCSAIMELLDELNAEGRTIGMVTHDSRFAEHASRKVELMDGDLI